MAGKIPSRLLPALRRRAPAGCAHRVRAGARRTGGCARRREPGAARPRARHRQRRGDHAMGHERAAPHPAFADEGVQHNGAVGRRPRQAGARAPDHRARRAPVREGNRHPRRRHDGRADDPARRRGKQARARRVSQGARARGHSLRKLSRGHPPADHRPARARPRSRQQDQRLGRRGRQLPRDGGVADGRRGRVPAVAHLHHRAGAGVAGCRRGESQARRAGALPR